jgi:formate-dependent nitrite reductase cytochrome c552 subunit
MRFTSLILVVVGCIIGALLFRQQNAVVSPHITSEPDGKGSLASSFQPEQTAEADTRHSVVIRKPAGPPKVKLASTDPQQRSAEVACSTCHSIQTPNLENKSSGSLDEFHQGLEFIHGQLACYACHNPNDADTLRLADGSVVEYSEVMTLCSQCHSKQANSFAHGAHGGMNGYWDLSRGEQTKNNCIDCHDAHAPKYPQMSVTFKPKDRFNPAEDSHAHQR